MFSPPYELPKNNNADDDEHYGANAGAGDGDGQRCLQGFPGVVGFAGGADILRDAMLSEILAIMLACKP